MGRYSILLDKKKSSKKDLLSLNIKVKEPTKDFSLTLSQVIAATKFKESHNRTCKFKNVPAQYSYKFTETDVGMLVLITCICGEGKKNITEGLRSKPTRNPFVMSSIELDGFANVCGMKRLVESDEDLRNRVLRVLENREPTDNLIVTGII